MSYPFNATLVPSVLADQAFQTFGIYIGQSGGIFYAVIDPRRHNINVWVKIRNIIRLSAFGYTGAVRIMGSHVFTNGPMMAAGCGSSNAWRIFSVLLPWYKWNSIGPVIHGGAIIDPGCPLGVNNGFFSRTGQGAFSCYAIGRGVPTGTEAIGGLVPLVTAGTPAATPSVMAIIVSPGIACWGLIPLPMPVVTDGWPTEVPYYPEADPKLLTGGLILCAGSVVPAAITTFPGILLPVGVTDAVAMDGSDSVIMGSGANIFFDCVLPKDKIQEYGFACF